MDKQKVIAILGNFIIKDYAGDGDRKVINRFPGLHKWTDDYILGSDSISLDDSYTTDELEAIVYVMRHEGDFTE